MRQLLLVPALATMLLAVACGPVKGYPGPARPSGRLATIDPNPIRSGIGVIVEGVDGMDVNAEFALTVLPGRRNLELRLRPYSRADFQEVSGPRAEMQNSYDLQWQTTIDWDVDVDAGGVYAITGRWQEGLYVVQFEEATNRDVLLTREVKAVRQNP
ncbi:MAG: hypothetical protein CMJ23_14755 [Phycisphaerae bacterium]|nr:hypothetical protein [Phycisphaerae bacterium]